MKPCSPCLDRPVPYTSSNHYHKHNSRGNSNNPEVNVRVLDAREILKVHAKVAAEEGQRREKDGHEGDDGHCRVGAGTCQRSVWFIVEGPKGQLTDSIEHQR
jgi:hypothetical protein